MKRPTPTYQSWYAMIRRCTDPTFNKYPAYGGSGITVCDRWKTMALFVADMGVRPAGMTIDRIDNSKGYEPGNCRWATPKQQANNRRQRQCAVRYDGKTAREWANHYSVTYGTIRNRLYRKGSPHP